MKLIGTSHIAQESVHTIEQETQECDIIAVELDTGRAQALVSGERKVSVRSLLSLGLVGALFALIGRFVQQKLGRVVGMEPGADMKAALVVAQRRKIRVALIDRPIQITLKRLSKKVTFREKMRFVWDIIRGLVQPKKFAKEQGLMTLDLSSVPSSEVISLMMERLKGRYPNVYGVLVHERNVYMARKLELLQKKFPEKKIVAVVGAGHKKGMEEILRENGLLEEVL